MVGAFDKRVANCQITICAGLGCDLHAIQSRNTYAVTSVEHVMRDLVTGAIVQNSVQKSSCSLARNKRKEVLADNTLPCGVPPSVGIGERIPITTYIDDGVGAVYAIPGVQGHLIASFAV